MAEIIDFKTRRAERAALRDIIDDAPWLIFVEIDAGVASLKIIHRSHLGRAALVAEAKETCEFWTGCEEEKGVPYSATWALAAVCIGAEGLPQYRLEFMGDEIDDALILLVETALDGAAAVLDLMQAQEEAKEGAEP